MGTNREYTVVLKDGSVHKFMASSFEYQHGLRKGEADAYLFWAYDPDANMSMYKAVYQASDVKHIYESGVLVTLE